MKIVSTNEIFNKYSSEIDFLREDDRYWSQIEKIALDIKNKSQKRSLKHRDFYFNLN